MPIKIFDIAFCSLSDGPGPRVVVFFQGCHARCTWCHSPHLQPADAPLLFFSNRCLYCGRCEPACQQHVHRITPSNHRLDRTHCRRCGECVAACPVSYPGKSGGALHLVDKEWSADGLFRELVPHLEIVRTRGGITLSGGEALLQTQGARELLRLCKENGFHTAVETSGLLPARCYRNVESLVDAWLFGMRFTTGTPGQNHGDIVHRSFRLIKEMNPGQIFPRIPVVPGHTDSERYLEQCARLLEKYQHRDVFLNPWNKSTGHYYTASGMPAPVGPIMPERVEACEEKIYDYFLSKDITPRRFRNENQKNK